jgi:N4-(beta-N-acetylglucosaminyl)-L-asparaginase
MTPPPTDWTRRKFLQTSAAALAAGALTTAPALAQPAPPASKPGPKPPRLPVVVASANGIKAIAEAMRLLREGKADPLDAVVAGVNIVEDDPTDHSVGLGGLPNEDGIVELDASCMHGPTHKAGAVAALRNIRNASSVARLVMRRTDHVLLVGEGALRFAKAHGFKEEDLLTDEAREMWLRWKETLSDEDDWLAPEEASPTTAPTTGQTNDVAQPPSAGNTAEGRCATIEYTWGTINCLAVDAASNLAGVTTTSGLSYKIPGRVGDSPIIGAGLYVDNAVGAAGSTGRGEANLQNCSSFMIVEFMRGGLSPEQACLEMLKRVADHTEPRLRDSQGRPTFGLTFYALAKDGRFGAASMWSDCKYAVHDGTEARLLNGVYLYQSPPNAQKADHEKKPS